MGLATNGVITAGGLTFIETNDGEYLLQSSTLSEPVRLYVDHTIGRNGLESSVLKIRKTVRVPDSNLIEVAQYHEVIKPTSLIGLPPMLDLRAFVTALRADATFAGRLALGLR